MINCAGLFSDQIAKLSGMMLFSHCSIPVEYYMLKDEARHLVKNLIYPVPDPRYPFLVHFTRTIDGAIEVTECSFSLAREGYHKTDFNLKNVGLFVL